MEAVDDDYSSGSDAESYGDDDSTIDFDGAESYGVYGDDDTIIDFDGWSCCGRRYAVLTEQKIRQQLSRKAAMTAEALSVPEDWALELLVHYRWRAYDLEYDWESDQAAVRDAVGLPCAGDTIDEEEEETTVTCGICLEAHPAAAMASAGCGRRFCHGCWRGYVATAFGDGARCLALRCPAASCRRAVLRGTVERFATGDGAAEYGRLLLRSYVDAPDTGLRPCPAPGCGCAVMFYAPAVGDVLCRCGRGFCWRCGGAPHWPASCAAVTRWARDADAASAAWLLVHAKRCPQCRRPIGRPDDGGCGSIVCAPPCSYRFCWRCLSPTSDPDRPRVSHYDCPELYAAEQEAEEDEEARAEHERRRERARRALEGFLHYDNLWTASTLARRTAERELRRLRDEGGCAWGVWRRSADVLAEAAWELVAEGRRVLENVCVLGRTLLLRDDNDGDGDGGLRARWDLLDFQLGQANAMLSRLQCYVEVGPEGQEQDWEEFSCNVMNLTCTTRRFIENFGKAVAAARGEVVGEAASSRSGWGGDVEEDH